jgi:hypothetical protein
MKLSKVLLTGMLAMALVFGLALTGCENPAGSKDGNPFVGTWTGTEGNSTFTFTFGETTWTMSGGNQNLNGTYTRDGNTATLTWEGGTATATVSGNTLTIDQGDGRTLTLSNTGGGNNGGGGSGGGGGDSGREQIGRISGTITLTNIPDPKPRVSISVSTGSEDNYWQSNGSSISLDSASGGTASNITWTIPLYENDKARLGTGSKSFSFWLYISTGSDQSFSIDLSPKTLALDDLSNIDAGNLGSVGIGSITLSGTVTASNGGQAIPRIDISAFASGGGNSIGDVWLQPTGTTTPWTMTVPVQQGTVVTFSVYGYDAATSGNQLFRQTISPGKTTSVSDQPISGIELDVGDISEGRMSGTVTFSRLPTPAPYEILVRAQYYYAAGSTDDGRNWHYFSGGAPFVITRNGNAGTWTIPRDSDSGFLEALEQENQKVRFYIAVRLSQNESSFSVAQVEIEVNKNNLAGIDLGSVSIPDFIRLSGTFTGTYEGATIPGYVYISPRVETGGSSGSGVSLNTPSAGTAWSVYLPVQETAAKVGFYVEGAGSGLGNLFRFIVYPAQTASVTNQNISGIVINIGNVVPNTLRVENPPSGTYTAYVANSYINESNYSAVSQSGNHVASGTGSGSSILLNWLTEPDTSSKYVLITAGDVTKYSNWADFFNGVGMVDWNAMTTVTGGGGGGSGGGGGGSGGGGSGGGGGGSGGGGTGGGGGGTGGNPAEVQTTYTLVSISKTGDYSFYANRLQMTDSSIILTTMMGGTETISNVTVENGGATIHSGQTVGYWYVVKVNGAVAGIVWKTSGIIYLYLGSSQTSIMQNAFNSAGYNPVSFPTVTYNEYSGTAMKY